MCGHSSNMLDLCNRGVRIDHKHVCLNQKSKCCYGSSRWNRETNKKLCFCLQQKSVARRKCAGCKISVHTMCMEQLEKVPGLISGFIWFHLVSSLLAVLTLRLCLSLQINFRCKPSFREPGSRAVREVSEFESLTLNNQQQISQMFADV